jgi:NADH-quinone oxidoreductase subunit M
MQNMIIVWALITIIYGGLVALYQSDYKRFLAYSSISQMGYILLGLATLTPAGVLGAVLHYLTHALGKASLFMTAGNIIISGNELRDINKMGGLASSMNKTAGSALLGFLSISGLPPTVGIISKFLIVAGFANYVITGFSNIYLMAILILTAFIGFGLTLVYSFHTMRRIFFGLRRSDIEVSEAPSMASLSTFVLAIFSIIFLILAGYLINQAHYSSDFMKIILMMR